MGPFLSLLRRERLVAGLLLGLLLLVGLWVLPTYGTSTDEPQQRLIGQVSLKYVAERYFPGFLAAHPALAPAAPLHQFWDRDYGVAYELPAAWLEEVLGLTDWRAVFLMRHALTFAICVGGVVALYQLGRRRFGDWRLGLLAATMLVLSPRLFGDLFYNNKDAVFMALLAIATNTAVRLVLRPTWGRAAGHALACALALDTRIMGLVVPAATLALLALQAARGAYRGRAATVAGATGLYAALLVGLAVLAWPLLWEAPAANFAFALQNMSKARWTGEILFAGQRVSATALPWYYAPLWIGITTPVLYLIGFVIGAGLILAQLVQRHWRLYATAAEWQDLLFLGLVLLPLVGVAVQHSVLYNGWRQLYFIYPALLLVAVRGLVALGSWRPRLEAGQRWWPRLSLATLALTFAVIVVQLVELHPVQAAYFNILAGRHLEERYDLDYWALSYQGGLEWVATHDDRPHILVAAQRPYEAESNRRMLPPELRDRLEVTEDVSKADYYITTFYVHPEPYDEFAYELTQLRGGGQRLLSVYRTRWEEPTGAK